MAQKVPEQEASARKVTVRVAPAYPDLAERLRIEGVVRLEVIVRPNGTIKTTKILGGNPVLVQAAGEAVNKWKFEPSTGETTEVVQLNFHKH